MKKIMFLILAAFVMASTAYGASAFKTDYESVAPSQSAQTLGPVGGTGDVLERLIIAVGTAATGTVQIFDGTAGPYHVTEANTPVGVYSVMIGARSKVGAWKVTTGAGASVFAVGSFK